MMLFSFVLAASKIGLTLNSTKVIGYYQPRENGIQLKDMDVSKITHLLYAFATVFADGTVTFNGPGSMDWDTWNTMKIVEPADKSCPCGTTCLKGYLNQLWRVKRDNPSLRTVLSIGGWAWSHNFSTVMKDPKARSNFIVGATDMMTKFAFDGFDIDWEFPAATWRQESEPGYSTDKADFANLATFLKETRDYWQSKGLPSDTILSVAMPPHLLQATEGKAVLGLLDRYCSFIMLMEYEFQHNSIATRLGAPLFSSPDDTKDEITKNIANGIKDYTSGINKNKLVMGIPLYATGFTNFASEGARKGTRCLGNTLNAKKDEELAAIDYKTMMSIVNENGYNGYLYDKVRGTSMACNGTHFYSFDTVESVSQKSQYVLDQGLGGVMIWDLSQDIGKDDPSKSLLVASQNALKIKPSNDRSFDDICLKDSQYCNLKCDYTPEKATADYLKNNKRSSSNSLVLDVIFLILISFQ